MAEAIGLASGLLTLATFAFQSSITLYNTVKSFQSHPKRVRDLIEELEALSGVLGSLAETAGSTTEIDLSALNRPLLRCGNACKEFLQEIRKCSSHSSGNQLSVRDWAKLNRKSSLTAENLEGYEDLIKTARDDLEAHLESIDEKLELILDKTVAGSDSDASEVQRIKEERLSTEKSLEICAQLSNHINQIQITRMDGGSSPISIDPDALPERVINEGLQECKNSLSLTAAKLERHMKTLMDRLLTKSRTATTSEDFADLERLRDEWEATRTSMDICSRADSHLKENISTIENYATGDAIQFMVSTNDKVIHGKNRGLGWRSRQLGGHVSDASLQQVSRDFTVINVRNNGNEDLSSRGNTSSVADDRVRNEPTPEYKKRYGPGIMLSPKPTPDMSMSSTGSDEGGPSKSSKK